MAGIAHSVHAPFRGARISGTVAPVSGLARRSGGAEDSALARRAAGGDGDAFAELYERHESRAFNLCYRILGSRDDAADATQGGFVGVLRPLPQLADRDFAFGSYLLTSARNACYDLIERGKRTQPSDEIPESATPMGGGVGGGGTGFDPGDPEDDPERNVLLEARNEEIRAANLALPERQREVLALRELEELSYDEIAELMDMNRNSVAQLISRARINLRDALRGPAALPRDDGPGRGARRGRLERDDRAARSAAGRRGRGGGRRRGRRRCGRGERASGDPAAPAAGSHADRRADLPVGARGAGGGGVGRRSG